MFCRFCSKIPVIEIGGWSVEPEVNNGIKAINGLTESWLGSVKQSWASKLWSIWNIGGWPKFSLLPVAVMFFVVS